MSALGTRQNSTKTLFWMTMKILFFWKNQVIKTKRKQFLKKKTQCNILIIRNTKGGGHRSEGMLSHSKGEPLFLCKVEQTTQRQEERERDRERDRER